MLKEVARYLLVAAAGYALWKWGQVVGGDNEVWDTKWFLPFYGASLGLAAAFGLFFPERAWRWGLIVVFALFPAMTSDAPPITPGANMWPLGLLMTAFLALPGAGVAAATGALRKRFTRA